MRLVLLDERGLGEQRLRLVLHRHELKVGDGVHHRPHLRRVMRAGTEVAQHALAEVLVIGPKLMHGGIEIAEDSNLHVYYPNEY